MLVARDFKIIAALFFLVGPVTALATIGHLAPSLPAEGSPAQSRLKVDAGYFATGSLARADSGVYTSVNLLTLATGGSCSSVRIGPRAVLTAAHCTNEGIAAWTQDLVSNWGQSLSSKISYSAANYAFVVTGTAGASREDWGVVVLDSEMPADVKTLEIAAPNEIYIGQPAYSVGYPDYIMTTDNEVDNRAVTRVVGKDCRIRNFKGDNILTDCYMARGSSGGPLLVKTKAGRWKIAGICSEESLDSNGEMMVGQVYADRVANVYSNVTRYRKRILSHVNE